MTRVLGRSMLFASAILLTGAAPALGVLRNDEAMGPTSDFPFAVKVGGASEFFCSGTIIGDGSHVITAQHCMIEGDDGASYRVMQSDGTLRTGVGQVALHPTLDVAMFRLDAPITQSVSLFTGSDEIGREVAFAGFGLSATTPGSGPTDLPYGTQRVGFNTLDAAIDDLVAFDFDLEGGIGAGGLGDREATTFQGDSGVGYLTEVMPGDFRLLGVHTGITPIIANRDQNISFGVRVSTINDWITSNIPAPGGVVLGTAALAGVATRRRRA